MQDSQTCKQTVAFGGVSFEAAVDASKGTLWLKEPLGECQPANYSTQRRRVERAGGVLGLAARVSEREAEQIRELLGIEGVEHDQARRMYIAAHGFRQRAGRCTAYSGAYQWTTSYGFACWALGLWAVFGRHRGFGSRS